MNRIKQLVKTVNALNNKKPIYLHIEGKQVEYIGGDGVYLQQPLNEETLGEQ
jgi:spore germination protein GerM